MFGGSVKKPLMTKVSMRHLNEIVRERNQYSRDAMEAWQDFINLKGRMDTELSKVTKRNNFLVEELESWKQQFLKFQAFAEQLTKETQDLKVKIESHKRENRRLTVLIDQQKDDAARLTVRLSGTEKQRDDALEALVLQQDIAEQLERERKANHKELAALKHTNASILRQRDESQRVVLHLRSLINGQTHHMEHIVRSLDKTPDVPDYAGGDYGVDVDDDNQDSRSIAASDNVASKRMNRVDHSGAPRTPSRASAAASENGDLEGDNVTPEMEHNFFQSLNDRSGSRLSIVSVADRHLRDKTDAIADIIRNISEQCAAAVEGLQLAHDAELHDDDENEDVSSADHEEEGDDGQMMKPRQDSLTTGGAVSEAGDNDGACLHPSGTHSRTSSIPPTPDLVPSNARSSTSMSMASASTNTQDRTSGQFAAQKGEMGPKIVEGTEEEEEARSEGGSGSVVGDGGPVTKYSSAEFDRPGAAVRGVKS